MEKNKYAPTYFEWIDSTLHIPVWQDMEEIIERANDPHRMITIGHLIHETRLEYILAGSIHFEEGEAIRFGDIYSIPKGCVLKKKKITI